MPLTPNQQGRMDRALEVLNRPHGYDAPALAEHIGRLDYWLRDMLAMVQELAGSPPADIQSGVHIRKHRGPGVLKMSYTLLRSDLQCSASATLFRVPQHSITL